ncbi:MAG: hypothetical protein EBT34_04595, partial [Acetobacteraceae bacterium]|nr:hypothetical protein [Acetobacteraceae bacterium]
MNRHLPNWRSLLYVPASEERFVAKAHERGADVIILDLEDGVAPDAKARARAGLAAAAASARRTNDPRYAALVKKVGDLGFNESGAMNESMPLHGEMSDSFF